MQALIDALAELGIRTGRYALAETNDAINRLWTLFAVAFVICIIGFGLNVAFNLKVPSLIFAIVYSVIAVNAWTKSRTIMDAAALAVAAVATTPLTLINGTQWALRLYVNLLLWALVGPVVFLFCTGVFSFQNYPAAGLYIIVALLVIGLFTWIWPPIFTGATGRKAFYSLAGAVIFVMIARLVFGPVVGKLGDKVVTEVQQKMESLASDKPFPLARPSMTPILIVSSACPKASASNVNSCVATDKEWTNYVQIAGANEGGKQFCYFPRDGIQLDRKNEYGAISWRFKAIASSSAGSGIKQKVEYVVKPTDYNCDEFRGE